MCLRRYSFNPCTSAWSQLSVCHSPRDPRLCPCHCTNPCQCYSPLIRGTCPYSQCSCSFCASFCTSFCTSCCSSCCNCWDSRLWALISSLGSFCTSFCSIDPWGCCGSFPWLCLCTRLHLHCWYVSATTSVHLKYELSSSAWCRSCMLQIYCLGQLSNFKQPCGNPATPSCDRATGKHTCR